MPRERTIFERVGGWEFFVDLVDRFYDRVEHDDVLRPLYPDDLSGSRRDLAGFLAQYWGGPPTYSMRKGHPRLRARHMPFTVGERERDRWVAHMTAAVDEAVEEADLAPELRAVLVDYFERTATFLRNA